MQGTSFNARTLTAILAAIVFVLVLSPSAFASPIRSVSSVHGQCCEFISNHVICNSCGTQQGNHQLPCKDMSSCLVSCNCLTTAALPSSKFEISFARTASPAWPMLDSKPSFVIPPDSPPPKA